MQTLHILKFGGTSVGSVEALNNVIQIVKRERALGNRLVVVVSAMSGVTNALLKAGNDAANGNADVEPFLNGLKQRHTQVLWQMCVHERPIQAIEQVEMLIAELADLLKGISLVKENSPRTNDLLLSFGERLSAVLITALLNHHGMQAAMVDARKIIKTDARFGQALVQFLHTNYLIQSTLQSFEGIPVVTGFIGSTERGETTTLGRGGSDYSASIIGAALAADEIHIYTDVDGMMTADPRLVNKAMSIPSISYQEAMELSHFGAKVIYPPALQPAFRKLIPIRILNTFNPEHPGTLICEHPAPGEQPVRGLSSIQQISLLNITGSGMVGVAGVAARVFNALALQGVSVILITQASSEHSISLAVSQADAEKAKEAIEQAFEWEIKSGKVEPCDVRHDVCIIAVIGENMRQAVGVSGKLFTALGQNGINVVATAQGSSELNISVVVPAADMQKALNVLHETFFLSDKKTIHCFLVGPGLIGSTLLKQISQQQNYLEESHHLVLKVCGISNSKRYIIQPEGIELSQWSEQLLLHGKSQQLDHFIQEIKALNLPNTVLIDSTSSEVVLPYYHDLLRASISIITPNKLASSGDYEFYKSLKQTAKRYNARFLYETNVGAGLPVIGTLQSLIQSGDRIIRIEAVLSGTLAYIFNTFSEEVSFATAVKSARERGYTEPDPRDDLSGRDMARKMLILARECGIPAQMNDVLIENILPPACLNAPDPNAFMLSLEQENDYFNQLARQTAKEGKKLRFMGVIANNQIEIKLQRIDATHPFWNMSGADNIVCYYTERYKERPLVVQGPGAGAEVTAAGVFAELISLQYR